MNTLWSWVRYQVIPPLFVVVFTILAQVLALIGQDRAPSWETISPNLAGSKLGWAIVLGYFTWAFVWLRVPAAKVKGPATNHGFTPIYHDNGTLYYFATMGALLAVHLVAPGVWTTVFEEAPNVLAASNILAFVLCFGLLLKGLMCPDEPDQAGFPLPYQFYRGIDLHPKVLGVDVKQLTNSRFGVMSWQVLVAVYYLAGVGKNGFSWSATANFGVQSLYLLLFFVYESWYFSTLDITLDRAGYYLCWGCLVWVPSFYTFTTYYGVLHPSPLSSTAGSLLLVLGGLAVIMKTRVDLEKTWFRDAGNRTITLWFRPAKFLQAKWTDARGKVHQSRLLISGAWGLARHFNYTMEILCTFLWTVPASYGPLPYLYTVFLLILLIHRTFRDEDKCQQKYGKYWTEYCKIVPYRFIPYVV